MNKVWEIVVAVVAGLGGIGVIFGAVIYFTSNFIAERLQKKYELKLNAQFKKIVALSNLIQRIYHNDIRNMLP